MLDTLTLNSDLVAKAVEAGHHGDKVVAVETALAEYVRLVQRRKLVEMTGSVDYHDGYPRRDKGRRTIHADEDPH